MSHEINIHRIVAELAIAVHNSSVDTFSNLENDPLKNLEDSIRLCARDLIKDGKISAKSPRNQSRSFTPIEAVLILDTLSSRANDPKDSSIRRLLKNIEISNAAIEQVKTATKQPLFPTDTIPKIQTNRSGGRWAKRHQRR